MRAINSHHLDVDRLAAGIAAEGLVPYNDAITAMVVRARSTGLQSRSVVILADDRQPEVSRQRAFGKVAAALARGVRRPDRHAA